MHTAYNAVRIHAVMHGISAHACLRACVPSGTAPSVLSVSRACPFNLQDEKRIFWSAATAHAVRVCRQVFARFLFDHVRLACVHVCIMPALCLKKRLYFHALHEVLSTMYAWRHPGIGTFFWGGTRTGPRRPGPGLRHAQP